MLHACHIDAHISNQSHDAMVFSCDITYIQYKNIAIFFQEKSQKWVKEVLLKSPADFEFFSGPSFNMEGALAMFVYEG
jgi:hypothetical protein